MVGSARSESDLEYFLALLCHHHQIYHYTGRPYVAMDGNASGKLLQVSYKVETLEEIWWKITSGFLCFIATLIRGPAKTCHYLIDTSQYELGYHSFFVKIL